MRTHQRCLKTHEKIAVKIAIPYIGLHKQTGKQTQSKNKRVANKKFNRSHRTIK